MPVEKVDSVQELLSGKEGPPQWISKQLADLPSLILRSEPSVIVQYTRRLENLTWELEQLELKKSVEFETGTRRLTQTMSTMHSEIKALRSSYRGTSPIQAVNGKLQSAEEEVQRMRQLLDSEAVKVIRELQGRKLRLGRLVGMMRQELQFRGRVAEMEAAMEEKDLDKAQACLEQLDQSINEDFGHDSGKGKQIEQLRHRLVEIIQSL